MQVGLGSSGLFLLIFLYINYWMRLVQGIIVSPRTWRTTAGRLIPILSLSGIVAYVAFTVAFWPIYSAASPVLFFLLYSSLVMIISILRL